MTKDEIRALRAQLNDIEADSRGVMTAQMNRLASDEPMTEEERQALYASVK